LRGRKPTPRRTDAERLPSPPDELNPDARKEWGRVARKLRGQGLFTELDRGMLAAYCQAYGRWAQAERALAEMGKLDPVTGGLMIRTKSGNAIQNPIVGTANKAMSDMARFAAELGMTPSARTRVANAAMPDKLGKKEAAAEAASTAGLGTDWGDDLTPSGRIN
jgi:P27 family predicted phage terminase small subunit